MNLLVNTFGLLIIETPGMVSSTRKKMQVAVAAGVVSGAAGSGMADLALNILVNQIDKMCIRDRTYTYPEAAHVGLTADAAQKLGYRTKVAVNHFSHSAKGYALG